MAEMTDAEKNLINKALAYRRALRAEPNLMHDSQRESFWRAVDRVFAESKSVCRTTGFRLNTPSTSAPTLNVYFDSPGTPYEQVASWQIIDGQLVRGEHAAPEINDAIEQAIRAALKQSWDTIELQSALEALSHPGGLRFTFP